MIEYHHVVGLASFAAEGQYNCKLSRSPSDQCTSRPGRAAAQLCTIDTVLMYFVVDAEQ